MDSVLKGLMGAMPLQNFWARTAPVNRCDTHNTVKPAMNGCLMAGLLGSQMCEVQQSYQTCISCG